MPVRGRRFLPIGGLLILPVSKWQENASEFLIFDTEDLSAGPIAQIDLPFQIGWTAHVHWMELPA